MLVNEHWDLLKLLIDKKIAGKIRLMYNINGSIIPDNGIKYWNEFKSVWLGISIDDVGKRLEYLRKGLDWNITLENMERLKRIKNEKITVQITPVISWMSVYYMDEFCKFLNSCGIFSTRYTCVYYPEFLSPWILPEKIKSNILKKCKDLMSPNDYERLNEQMIYHKTNLKLLHQGILYNKMLDKIRNENFSEIFPELYEEIKYYWDEE